MRRATTPHRVEEGATCVASTVMEDGESAGRNTEGDDGTSTELDRLRARVAELEEENDLLAVAATREPALLADINR